MAGRFLFDAVYLQKFRMQPVRPLVEVLQNKKHRGGQTIEAFDSICNPI